MTRNTAQRTATPRGQAGLIAILGVGFSIIMMTMGVGSVTVQQRRVTTDVIRSAQSYYAAESGAEDALLRLMDNDLPHQSPETITVGGSTVTITTTLNGTDYTIEAEGDTGNRIRTVTTTLARVGSYGNFSYGMQAGIGGITIGNNAEVNGNVYSNGNIIGGNNSEMNGQVVVAGGMSDTPTTEWTTHTADTNFATAAANRDIAQSFTAGANGPINWVSVYIAKVGNPSALTLEIHADDAGSPDKSELASTSLPATIASTTPGWVTVAFATPATVTNGTKYWIVLNSSSSSGANYWKWRRDAADGYANNTGKYTDNCCTGNPSWSSTNGDQAFRVWIGGTMQRLANVDVGDATSGSVTANLITSSTVHGSSCPNQYCLLANPPVASMPLDAATIQGHRDDAADGDVCEPPLCDDDGNLVVTDGQLLGPIHIPGNLTLDGNGTTLTITGTVWVEGNVSFSNNCIVRLSSDYGPASGVIITDGTITISNNCAMSGSGQNGSYLMLISDKNDPTGIVMDVSNNATGVIYYASQGILNLANNAIAKNATGHKIIVGNDAVVTYDQGLQSVFFGAGGSGTDEWQIQSWREVE